jgi:hypothetical protein
VYREDAMEEQRRFDGAGNKGSEEIKKDIERTREDMGDTIDEIKERLSPRYMKERVKEATIEKTKDMIETTVAHAREWGESVGRNAKAHPGWYAAGGAGAGGLVWLLLRRRNKNGNQSWDIDESFGGSTESFRMEQSRVKQTAATVQQKATEVKERFTDKVERNPLALGAITTLFGAMAGFMLPESTWEREGFKKAREIYGSPNAESTKD